MDNGKFTETALALEPIQMGARIYLPTIGRFTSQDPIPGGNANAYTYSLDPINLSDISGLSSGCAILCVTLPSGGGVNLQGGVGAAQLQPTVSVARVTTSHFVSRARRAHGYPWSILRLPPAAR